MMLVTFFCGWFFLWHEDLRAGFRKVATERATCCLSRRNSWILQSCKVRPAPGSMPPSLRLVCLSSHCYRQEPDFPVKWGHCSHDGGTPDPVEYLYVRQVAHR